MNTYIIKGHYLVNETIVHFVQTFTTVSQEKAEAQFHLEHPLTVIDKVTYQLNYQPLLEPFK